MAFEGIVAEWDEVQGDEIAIMIGAKPDDHRAPFSIIALVNFAGECRLTAT